MRCLESQVRSFRKRQYSDRAAAEAAAVRIENGTVRTRKTQTHNELELSIRANILTSIWIECLRFLNQRWHANAPIQPTDFEQIQVYNTGENQINANQTLVKVMQAMHM